MRYRDVSPTLLAIKRKLEITGNQESMRSTTSCVNPLLNYAHVIEECIEAIDRNEKKKKSSKKPVSEV